MNEIFNKLVDISILYKHCHVNRMGITINFDKSGVILYHSESGRSNEIGEFDSIYDLLNDNYSMFKFMELR